MDSESVCIIRIVPTPRLDGGRREGDWPGELCRRREREKESDIHEVFVTVGKWVRSAMSTGKRLAKRSILGTKVMVPGPDGKHYPGHIQAVKQSEDGNVR